MKDQGNVPSNCAIALGMVGYEPAKERIIERLAQCESLNTLFGIAYYLGKIRKKDCHEVLRDLFRQMGDHYFVDMMAHHLLEHGDPQDVPAVLDACFKQADLGRGQDTFLSRLMDSIGAKGLYNDLTKDNPHNLLEAPRKHTEVMLSWNPMIDPGLDILDSIIHWIENLRYQDMVAALLLDARNVLSSRYPNGECPGYYQTIFKKDRLSLAFLTDFSKRSVGVLEGTKDRTALRNFLAAVLACYLSIREREGYLSSVEPDATLEDMITALKHTGPECPGAIQDRLIALKPIASLKTVLTDELDTWGDIWTVRLIGMIGKDEFIPDLIRVLRSTDDLSFVHEDAMQRYWEWTFRPMSRYCHTSRGEI